MFRTHVMWSRIYSKFLSNGLRRNRFCIKPELRTNQLVIMLLTQFYHRFVLKEYSDWYTASDLWRDWLRSPSRQHLFANQSYSFQPHQRITRYGILLDPIIKRIKDPELLENLKKCRKQSSILCRWINGRVTLHQLAQGQFHYFCLFASKFSVKSCRNFRTRNCYFYAEKFETYQRHRINSNR